MSMPERPTLTHNQQWPHSIEHGTFDFHVEAFQTGEPRRYDINYQADGYDNYYCLAARRSGQGLLVSFTDTADQPRSPVEIALRASQAAEKRARQQVEQANQELEARVQERTEQLQVMNEALGLTNQQLSRTNVDLDNFIYTASHDLKAPITNIEGLLHVLQHQLNAAGRPDVSPVLGMMHESVVRFKRTIDQLGDVTKLQKEHGQPTTEVLLAPVLHDVAQDLQPLLQQTGARLEVDVAATPSVLFSAKNLRSVLYNLLSNALKYRHPDRAPLVRVSGRQEEGYVVLAVHDNGLGLTAEQLPELFGMFRRLHSHVDGSGLGLYMVQRSVENAGGKVLVASELGVGSVFSVYFPR